MQYITIAHADDVGAENLAIRIEGVPPKFETRNYERAALNFYAEQAAALETALWERLPGGTYDALLYHMLERRAGILRVSYAQARGEK